MVDKISVKLGDVQKTLLFPLWGRAVETKKTKPLLIDKTASQVIQKIDFDFSEIEKNLTAISQHGWIARCYHMDLKIKHYLEIHPTATIVNIGCGLDTTFERIDNGRITWYDLDLPDVIALRKKLLPMNERQMLIENSFLNHEWIDQLGSKENVLLIAAGVLYYFEEDQIKKTLKHISESIQGGEMIFDASSPIGVQMANKMVIKAGGMDDKSFLKWGIRDAKLLESWDERIKLLEQTPMFRKVKKNFSFKEKIIAWISDMLKMQYIIHLKFLK